MNLLTAAPVTATAPRLRRRTRADRQSAEALLAPAAMRSAASRGRARPEPADPVRTAFEVDRDRIIHSCAFRRLQRKTQVFVDPAGDHVTTRLTHTLQVASAARALADGLGLNATLAEAIALGHDVGHAPFGHTGETALAAVLPGGWHHAAHGVRVLGVLEDCNLCWEVVDGIRAHTWKVTPGPATAEAWCVRYADRIAYLSHDTLDAVRAGVLVAADLPAAVRSELGQPAGRWVGALVDAVVDASVEAGRVTLDGATLAVLGELRAFLFDRVYAGPDSPVHGAAVTVVSRLVEHYRAYPRQVAASVPQSDPLTQAVDHVAGMTDRFALACYADVIGPPPPALR